TVQNRGAGSSIEHRCQLPNDIGGITDSLTHPLSDERRCLMGCITKQKQVMLTPALRYEGMESITRCTPYRRLRGLEPALEQAPQDIRMHDSLGIFAGQQHDFPPP